MKNKVSLVVLFAMLVAGLSGCTSGGSAIINCVGFSINNMSVNNPPSPSGPGIPLPISATGTQGATTLFTGTVYTAPVSASPTTFSVTKNWTTAPIAGTITLIVGGNFYTGTCDPNNPSAGFGGTGNTTFTDGRINPDPDATVVGYCNNGAIKVWVLNSEKWFFAGNISKRKILDSLEQAVNTGKHVLMFEKSGQQVWALSSNEIQFHNANGVKYDAIVPGNVCN